MELVELYDDGALMGTRISANRRNPVWFSSLSSMYYTGTTWLCIVLLLDNMMRHGSVKVEMFRNFICNIQCVYWKSSNVEHLSRVSRISI